MKNTTQIIIAAMLLVSFALGQVTIDGYAYLDNQSDHSGITITFVRTAPSIIETTIETDNTGSFSITFDAGIYDISYEMDNYFSYQVSDVSMYNDTTLPHVTLNEHVTLIEIPTMFSEIQSAIEAASNGDTLLLLPGTYNENIIFNGKQILITSMYHFDSNEAIITETVIDGGSNGATVSFINDEDTTSILAGLTIRGSSSESAGILCGNANPIIRDANIEYNNGDGIKAEYSNPIISNVHIRNNLKNGISSKWGGGTMDNFTISGNQLSGVYCWVSTIEVQNGTISHNGTGVQCKRLDTPTIRNVVIAFNQSYGVYSTFGVDSHTTIYHSTIHANGGSGIFNDIETFPGFIDIYNSIISNNDLFGINGTQIDVQGSCISGNGTNFEQVNEYIGINVTINANGDSCDTYNNISEDPSFAQPFSPDLILSDYSRCIGSGNPEAAIPPFDILENIRPYPSGSNPDVGAYENPFGTPQRMPVTINIPDDYATIQAGLNAADSTDIVLVQPGTYYENIIWPETNGIKLISAGDSSNTTIDGGGISSVIYMNPQTVTIDTTTLIQGFKITNGSSINGGGLYLKGSPKIANNHIMNNICEGYGTYGGGAYIEPGLSVAIMENSHFSTNSSWRGGAIYKEGGSLVVRNVKIIENLADQRGGGLAADGGNILVEGSVISGNIGGDGAGIHSRSNSLVCNNTLIEGNSGSSGGGITVMYGSMDASYITIRSNTSTNRGGGIYLSDGVQADINNAQIYDNTARLGGGLYDGLGNVTISNSKIISNVATEDGGGLYMEGSTVTFDSTSILRNYANNGGAAYLDILDGNFTNNTIWGNTSQNTHGIYLSSHGTLNSLVISNSNINNNGYSVRNENAQWVTANSNYWGHSSGPYHTSQNPNGQGDSVNVIVDVSPWLSSPANSAPPISINSLIIVGTGNDFINLEWDPSPLGDFGGFKLYYDTDESGFPYEYSVDVGINTSHPLSGLNLGTEYYLAVTVYDTDGNESWYSNEVTGVTRVMEVQNLDIAGDEHLYHLVTHDPLVTFDYFDSMGETQTNYHLQISTDSTFQTNIIWDSGEVASDATSIQYTEGALLDGVKYYLRAKVASGTFWSEWEDLAFGMNTEPTMPAQLSLIGDEVTTSDVLLEISNSSDAEEDILNYDFRLYDATQAIQLDSAIAVAHNPDGTEWEVITALVDNSQHWWTVQAFDGYEYSELAGPESFLINFENDDPAAFDLTSPLLDESIINQSPLFTWSPAVDPDPLDTVRYVLYLDTPDPGGETFYPGIDTSFQLDYDLEDNTTYHWKVVAHDLNDSETESNGGYQSFTVNTANDLPEYFELLYPVWDEMGTNLQPEFLWEASSDPDDETIVMRSKGKGRLADQSGSGNTVDVITGYDFYLSTDSMLTEVVPVEVIGTSYTPTEDLLENQTYYWAVSAIDDSGGVTFSDTASFWTNAENEAPAEFELLLPTDAEVLTVLSPTFTWESSDDPDLYDGFGYHLILGNSPEDMDTLWSGEDTTITLEWELDDNMTYYWAVFAEDWSDVETYNVGGFQSFVINQGNDAPSMVELITPDSVLVLTLTPEMVWSPAMDADPGDVVSYEMHWWGDGIEFDSVLTDTNAVFVTSELEDNTQYFWEVIAMDQTDGISHSEEVTFWTDLVPEAPGAFALIAPEDDVAGLSDMPSFEWVPSVDPDPMDYATYTIQIASDSSFVDVVFDANTEVDVALDLTEALATDTEYWWRVVATDTDSLTTESETFKFTVGYVAIAEALALPTEFVLDQNFPNPFNPSTTLRYGIPEDSDVSLIIYDIRGNTVRSIESGAQVAGWYEHIWNGLDDEGQPISTGLYIARLSTPSFIKSIKMVYLK